MGAGVHVFHKNHELLIIRSGDTNGDGHISTADHFLRVFYDVTVGGVCTWLEEGCLGIDLLLILYFAPGGAEVINEVMDGAIFVVC